MPQAKQDETGGKQKQAAKSAPAVFYALNPPQGNLITVLAITFVVLRSLSVTIAICTGWQVYVSAGPEKRMYTYFRPPDGSRALKSFRELDDFLQKNPQELPHGPEIRCGEIIEAEMIDEEADVKEWIRGTVQKRNRSSFQVRFAEINENEPWEEEYSIKEKGLEWRWPLLNRHDFEDSIAAAKAACQEVSCISNRKIDFDRTSPVFGRRISVRRLVRSTGLESRVEESARRQRIAGNPKVFVKRSKTGVANRRKGIENLWPVAIPSKVTWLYR